MRRLSSTFVALVLSLTIPLPGCDSGTESVTGRQQDGAGSGRKNVLLVTLDTTRADRIGCYGCSEISTPNIDAIASEGVRVENAYATVPMTLPSHASMLTGRYPFSHGIRNNTHYTLGFGNVTLAEVLQEQGYRTAAFIGATILEGRLGLDQGFDQYFDDMFSGIERYDVTTPWASRKASNVNWDIFNWLDSLPPEDEENIAGWFAWVHYYDPHFRYDPPEPFYSQYSHDLYLGEIAFMDDQLGRIIDRLRELGMYDNTLIVIVGDHGEGLGDHDEVFHALWTYDSTLRVPFIISDPESREMPSVIEGPASVIDVFPTILAWCGIEIPESPGIDLLSGGVQAILDERPVYFESMEARINYNWAGLRGIVDGSEKYIHTPIPEYYDLEQDAGETSNLFEAREQRARELKTGMYRLVDEWRDEVEVSSRELSPEDIARLQSLGYITGGAVPATSEDLESIENLPDLKSMRDVVDDVSILREEGDAAFEIGDYDTAREKYIELLQYAEIYTAVQHLGEIAASEGNEEEALDYLRRTVELGPTLALSWYNLAVAYRNFGRHDEAVQVFEQAIMVSPSDPVNTGSHVALAVYLSENGDWEGALDHITTARELDNENRELIGHEASIRYQIGTAAESEAANLSVTLQAEHAGLDDPRMERYEELRQIAESELGTGYDLYMDFLSRGEGSMSHFYEAGQCAIRQGDYQMALRWTGSAVDLLPPGDANRTALEALINELESMAPE